MAIIEVKVPQLSESVAEATLLDWHKKEGERVSRDENLIDIETDKVVLELPAPADGVLVKILKQAKDSVGSGDVIAQIDTEGKAAAAAAPAAPKRESAPGWKSANRSGSGQGGCGDRQGGFEPAAGIAQGNHAPHPPAGTAGRRMEDAWRRPGARRSDGHQ